MFGQGRLVIRIFIADAELVEHKSSKISNESVLLTLLAFVDTIHDKDHFPNGRIRYDSFQDFPEIRFIFQQAFPMLKNQRLGVPIEESVVDDEELMQSRAEGCYCLAGVSDVLEDEITEFRVHVVELDFVNHHSGKDRLPATRVCRYPKEAFRLSARPLLKYVVSAKPLTCSFGRFIDAVLETFVRNAMEVLQARFQRWSIS